MNLFLLSDRLKLAMLEKEKRDGVEVKPADLARATNSSDAAVSHWLKDENGIGAKKARLAAEYLGVNSMWIECGEGEMLPAPKHNDNKSKVFATHPDDPQSDEMVYVKESRISFAAGNGRIANYELIEDEEPASYRLSWFQKYGINPEKVRRFRVAGDSMEPMLFHRDTILVNTEETAIVDNKVYAIRYGDDLRVKFLIKKLDGTIILRSMNPHYKDEEISPELAAEHISVIGRVRDKSGTGGL